MKLFSNLFAILALIFTFTTTALATPGPFHPHEETRFAAIESTNTTQASSISTNTTNIGTNLSSINTINAALTQTADGVLVKRVVRVEYDTAVDGGTIGAYDLGQDLPANALITQAYFYTVTQFTDGGSGTVALSCEDANNIFTATDITGNAAGVIVAGAADGTAGNMVGGIAAACNITATVAGAEQTAGKLILFVEYVVVE